MNNTQAKPIYVGGDLHAKLKSLAATERRKLGELCELHLWRVVKKTRKAKATK